MDLAEIERRIRVARGRQLAGGPLDAELQGRLIDSLLDLWAQAAR